MAESRNVHDLARELRLSRTDIYVDGCWQDKGDPPCAVCQAVERGIAAGIMLGWRAHGPADD